jgi:hypothetical protein
MALIKAFKPTPGAPSAFTRYEPFPMSAVRQAHVLALDKELQQNRAVTVRILAELYSRAAEDAGRAVCNGLTSTGMLLPVSCAKDTRRTCCCDT